MFKKRIRSWGKSKNWKAIDKDGAIQALLGDASTKDMHAKLVRHVKARIKAGTLDKDCLYRIMKQSSTYGKRHDGPKSDTDKTELSTKPFRKSAEQLHSGLYLGLTGEVADTELLLRALKTVVVAQGMTPTRTQWQSYTSIRIALETGVRQWDCSAFAKARRAFELAGQTMLASLKSGELPALSFIKDMGRYDWSVNCHMVRDRWRDYVAACARDILAIDNSFTLVMGYMQQLPDDDYRELAMWNYMLDHLSLSTSRGCNAEEWWQIGCHRLQHCEESGWYDLAKHYNHETKRMLHENGLLNADRELSLLQELADVYRSEGDLYSARESLQRMMEVAEVSHGHQEAWHMSEAMRGLAIVEEKDGNIEKALHYREDALRIRVSTHGIRDHDTMYTLARLLEFCNRQDLNAEYSRIIGQHSGMYEYLEESTEGLWKIHLDAGVAENLAVDTLKREYRSRPRRRLPTGVSDDVG